MKTANNILSKFEGNEGVSLNDAKVRLSRPQIIMAMEEYAQEYYNYHKIELKDSDCTCCGDQYGMATNPECILHGKNRKCLSRK